MTSFTAMTSMSTTEGLDAIFERINGSLKNLTHQISELGEDYPFDVVRDVRFISLSLIIPLGLITNSLSVAVFSRRHMRKTTPGLYFLSLALADNVVLTGELFLWMGRWDTHGYRFGYNIMGASEFLCKTVNFLRHAGRLWSSWLVVAISIERFISIVFPFSCHKYTSPTKARIVILVLSLLSAGLASTAFVAIGLREYKNVTRCLILEPHEAFYNNWQIACLVAGEMFIPSILVTIFTALLVWNLRKEQNTDVCRRITREKRHHSKERQPTVSLIAIAITFVTLRFPYICAYQIYTRLQQSQGSQDHAFQVYSAYSIAYIFAVLNYSLNFWLFFAFGSTFRTELLMCLLCRRTSYDPQTGRMSYRAASLYSQYGRHGLMDANRRVSVSVSSSPVFARIKRLHQWDTNSI